MVGALSLPTPDKSPAPAAAYGAPAAAAPEGYGSPQEPACTLERVNEPSGNYQFLLNFITFGRS